MAKFGESNTMYRERDKAVALTEKYFDVLLESMELVGALHLRGVADASATGSYRASVPQKVRDNLDRARESVREARRMFDWAVKNFPRE